MLTFLRAGLRFSISIACCAVVIPGVIPSQQGALHGTPFNHRPTGVIRSEFWIGVNVISEEGVGEVVIVVSFDVVEKVDDVFNLGVAENGA